MGWTGAAIPEEYGGAGLGHLGLVRAGRGAGLGAGAGAVLVLGLSRQRGHHRRRQRGAEEGLAAEAGVAARSIGTLALAEGPGKADVRKLRTTFRNGALERREAARARRRCGRRRRRRRPGRARRRRSRIVDLHGVRRHARRRSRPSIPAARTRASPSTARPPRRSARPATASACSGACRTARPCCSPSSRSAARSGRWRWRATMRSQRYAFGRPIGSFQAIKHKLADVYVATELARSNAYYGAWALARDAPELPRGRRVRAHLGQRGLLPGGQGEHPGARRHGLHLGVRLPPLLPPRQAARARARQHQALEGPPHHPARDGQRAAL